MIQQLKTAAILRQRGENRRVGAALAGIKKTTTRPWTERNPLGQERLAGTTDQEWAFEIGIPIRRVEIERLIDNKVITIPQYRLDITSQNRERIIKRLGHWASDAIRVKDTDLEAKTEAVVEYVLPGGRVICVPSRQTSFLQRCAVNVLSPRLEVHGVLSDHLHSYRPARSTMTALADISRLARDKPFYAKGDIQRFFPSVTHELVMNSLKDLCPWMAADFRDTVHWLISPGLILRKPTHPHRLSGISRGWDPGPKHLLQGDVLSPLLSNIVGAHVLDRPIARLASPTVTIVRYSDDFVILGSDPAEVEETMLLVEAVLRKASLKLHPSPDKTMKEAANMNVTPLLMLGKMVHGNSVYTPDETLEDWARGVVSLDPVSGLYRRKVIEILSRLTPNDLKRLSYFQDRIRRLGGSEARRSFHAIYKLWQRREQGEMRKAAHANDYFLSDHVVRVEEAISKTGANPEHSGKGSAIAPGKQHGAHHALAKGGR